MATSNRPVFEDDSDEDSINTDSTAASEPNESQEYNVEGILAEAADKDDGETRYLIKWEGYPLYRSNWQRRVSIDNDNLIQDWEQDKIAVARGEKKPFDPYTYDLAVEHFWEEKDERDRRREAKRQRRLHERANAPVQNESGDDVFMTKSPRRKRARTPPKKKGVAQTIPKRRRSTATANNEEVDTPAVSTPDSDMDSLFGDAREPATPALTARTKTSALKGRKQASLTSEPVKQSMPANTNPKAATALGPKPGPTASAAGRAPTTNTRIAKRSTNASAHLFVNWDKDKRRRQRMRVSGATPKDSTDPKFTHLSIQNRYQKYGKNEPAPNPDALIMVDPKTGMTLPPKTISGLPTAYGRRSPPRTAKRRSLSPRASRRRSPSPRAQAMPGIPIAQAPGLDHKAGSHSLGTQASVHSYKQYTCKHWQRGNCQKTADSCGFLHGYPPKSASKKDTTCFYWYHNRQCRKRDWECEFAHRDTGIYSGPPGSYSKDSTTGDRSHVKDSDLRLVTDSSRPTYGSIDKTTVPQQTPSGHYTMDSPIDASMDGKQPGAIAPSRSPARDPRRRASIVEKTEPSKQAATDTNDESLKQAATDSDDEPLEDTTEADFALAKVSKQNLSSTTLLGTKNGAIDNVFIHMPKEKAGEANLLRDYFSGLQRKVYTSHDSTSHDTWDFFRKNLVTSALLVVHPDENFVGTLPGLNKFIRHGAAPRTYSIGVQHSLCLGEQRPPRYEAQQLFPHGSLTFITDDVFVYFPEKALAIIEEFLEETKLKPPGAQMSKIGARPGVKDWILKFSREKVDECDRKGEPFDLRWLKCYDALDRLCPTEDENPYYRHHHVPLERSYLWSFWEGELPNYKGMWESDERKATDYMANLFAGESRFKAWQFRRFNFVYQRPDEEQVHDPHGWGSKYCQIGVILPEQALKGYKK